MRILLFIIMTMMASVAVAEPRGAPATVAVCFTPGENCEAQIAAAIDDARRDVHMQAYGLTSTAILQALRRAIERGVKVEAILDASNEGKRYGAARYLMLAGAGVWIDDTVAIAHNKVIVIDGEMVIGGSFNFTKAAQTRNAENVTFIESRAVADLYLANWRARLAASRPYDTGVRRPQ